MSFLERFGMVIRFAAVALATMLSVSCMIGPAAAQSNRSSAAVQPAQVLLTPTNSVVVLLDHQPTVTFAVQSIDRTALVNNTVGLAKTAKAFGVPTILSTIQAASFSGPIYPDIQSQFPQQRPIDRTTRNAWSDAAFVRAVEATGRRNLVLAGLWTEVCLTFTTLSALQAGYNVFIVTDASGGTSDEAHRAAVSRMTGAGAIPVSWQQVMLEYAEAGTSPAARAEVGRIVAQHSGVLGLNALYAERMLGAAR